MERPDVVIVGSGIGGGGLATVLAREGLEVLVLERETAYRDKVRGETMFPWGAAEMRRVGLEDVFLAAGGGYAARFIAYDEIRTPEESEATAISFAGLVAGVPGQMNVGHPEACEALTQAAAKGGAAVVRGVRDVTLRPGELPEVDFTVDGVERHASPRLVVGADGRTSSVRRQCRISLEETEPQVMLGGLLVGDVLGRPGDANTIGCEGDFFYLAFPRPGGLERLYLTYAIAQKNRFTGAERTEAFLEVFRSLTSMPSGEALAAATSAGPVGAYPMTATWTDTPFADGVVLMGDAAGWSDPTIGQGLSVTMRDVRMVSEAMLGDDDWSSGVFEEYASERTERLRQLRISLALALVLRCDFGERGRERRAAYPEATAQDSRVLIASGLGVFGPNPDHAEMLTDDLVDVVRDLGR